ncbi:alkaline serine protease [Colletotrichum truncatum]|uniref:Alkaline serine protease n=1 Tax=Colletotrichum truncatum TaxID=5467 RepID=A0ACC3YHI7_COLTU|nr:alkaline serine protease [Colletotrichum truncatum]KAF6792882.1 alkaline serine protease [Colletotrichum truncatum]
MHFTQIVSLSILFLVQQAKAEDLRRDRVVYSSNFPSRSSSAHRAQSLPKDEDIYLDFALTIPEEQLQAATQALQDISNPASINFGHAWTGDQVAELLAPPKDSIQKVAQWLNESNVHHSDIRVSSDRGHLYVKTTLGQAEELLEAQYHKYLTGPTEQVASDTYSLPEHISKLVDFAMPGLPSAIPPTSLAGNVVEDPNERRQVNSTAPRSIDDCFRYMSPECLRLLYNIPWPSNTPTHPNNSQGIFQISWQTWLPEDLDAFFELFQPALVGQRPEVLPIAGGYLQTEFKDRAFNLESNLDHEYAMALSYPQPVKNVQVGGRENLGNLNLMLAAFDQEYCATGLDANFDPLTPTPENPHGTDCGTADPPLVISVSYAWNEVAFSEQYVRRQCLEFLKLGLRGVTVIAATGDRGTADQLDQCRDPSSGQLGAGPGHFSANFPASCPWVTAVGGTQLSPTNVSWVKGETPFPPETALRLSGSGYEFTSGGGFSGLFPAPWYQKGAVESYLGHPGHQTHLSNLSSSGYFDNRGRGFPDVSAMALNYLVRTNDKLITASGTSAAAPVFASMITKINDARLKSGKGPVGFVNPVLYSHSDSFSRDVSTGSNGGCGVPLAFPAGEGWDAVTGLGTIDFESLLATYLSLP